MARGGPVSMPIRQQVSPRVLWIGARGKSVRVSQQLGTILDLRPSQIFTTRLADVSPGLIAQTNPTVACSMLTWIGGDALEAAIALSDAGYRGAYWTFGPNVPSPNVIQEEVRESAPGIELTIMSPSPPLRRVK